MYKGSYAGNPKIYNLEKQNAGSGSKVSHSSERRDMVSDLNSVYTGKGQTQRSNASSSRAGDRIYKKKAGTSREFLRVRSNGSIATSKNQ